MKIATRQKSVDQLLSELYGTISVKYRGISPLLMNKMPETLRTPPKPSQQYIPEEDAERSAYRIRCGELDKVLYVPNTAIYKSAIVAAGPYKIGRKGLKTILSGTIIISPEEIPLIDLNDNYIKDYIIDSRYVTIDRKAVIKHRARLNEWRLAFKIQYDKAYFTQPVFDGLRKALEDAGRTVGILDYRPARGGWFGKYIVEEFNVIS